MVPLLLLAALVPLAGCSSGMGEAERADAITTLDVHAWKERLDATPGAFVLDVRTPQEFSQGRIAGATLIPFDQVRARASELPEDRDAPVFVYCRTGNRSAQASATLEDLGYTNVVNMVGGYPDWAAAGYPTER